LFERVAIAFAVAAAHPTLRQRAHWVTDLPGGHGAVREVCDLLLQART
jgi:3-deoxy-D-manno-octulosonate 8-phosphate phosphatase (KDO 8-P phosphatase)